MSAAAAAALKKVAAAAATDKNVAKTIGGIAIGVILVLITPILAIIAIFQGGAEMDLTAMAAQAKNDQLAYFEQVKSTARQRNLRPPPQRCTAKHHR